MDTFVSVRQVDACAPKIDALDAWMIWGVWRLFRLRYFTTYLWAFASVCVDVILLYETIHALEIRYWYATVFCCKLDDVLHSCNISESTMMFSSNFHALDTMVFLIQHLRVSLLLSGPPLRISLFCPGPPLQVNYPVCLLLHGTTLQHKFSYLHDW